MSQNIKAEEIMRSGPVELSPEDPAHWVTRIMEDHDACHLPVTVNGQLLGMVSRLRARSAHLFDGIGYLVALDFMKTNPIRVYPETALRELSQTLIRCKQYCLAVVNPRDEVLGAVHASDILRLQLPQAA